jgi:hypothetical protein
MKSKARHDLKAMDPNFSIGDNVLLRQEKTDIT